MARKFPNVQEVAIVIVWDAVRRYGRMMEEMAPLVVTGEAERQLYYKWSVVVLYCTRNNSHLTRRCQSRGPQTSPSQAL
jgi:hypothetical protein